MTARDYKRAAALVRERRAAASTPEQRRIATFIMLAFAEFFEGDNPMFESDTFIKECQS